MNNMNRGENEKLFYREDVPPRVSYEVMLAMQAASGKFSIMLTFKQKCQRPANCRFPSCQGIAEYIVKVPDEKSKNE